MKRGASLVTAAEAGLAVVTLAVVLGMNRLFQGGGWVGPLVLNVAAAHLVAAVCRRRGLSLPVTAVVMAGGAVLVGTWACYWATTAAGVPTGDTWSAMRVDLEEAWDLFATVAAPAPVLTGFVLASAVAIWAVAYVADWAAFRLWVPFEATLPAGTLFLFTALLATEPRGQAGAVAMYAGGLIAFLLLHRLTRQDGTSHWVGDRRRPGHRALLLMGGSLGVVAVAAGTILGPSLPGADSPGIVDARGLGEDQTRQTLSPLVDIRSRLVDLSAIEVFRVTANEPAYWRMTSLERFDGRIWWSSGNYDDAAGELPQTLPDELDADVIQQEVTVSALSTIWLPAAYAPRAIDSPEVDVLYDDESGTLIVDRQLTSSDGITYAVTSTAPRFTAAQLDGAPRGPGDADASYTDLPDDFSPEVRALARDLTSTAGNAYEAALALQNHLRTFTYDLEVGPGHSEDALEEFLFTSQRGYCEQFAGSFAAMARSIGLPARVAVGFTQGIASETDPNTYIVRGEHAHAWPEVFLDGAGWVAFEPTPGRGMPFAEDYTGVDPAQAAPGDPGGVDTATSTTSADTLPTTPTSFDARDPFDELDTGQFDPAEETQDGTSTIAVRVLRPLAIVAAVVLAIGLLDLILLPLVLLWARRRRRQAAAAGPPADRVRLAWEEAAAAAAVVGYREVRSDTYAERAGRLSAHLETPGVGDAAANLAHRLEVATFSATGADELDAELAAGDAVVIRQAVRAEAGLRPRVQAWVDPRPYVRRWSRARGVAHRHISTPVPSDPEAATARTDEPELVSSGS